MLILAESDVFRVGAQLIRMGGYLFQSALQLSSLTETKQFLHERLEANQVYLAVRIGNAYQLYQEVTEPDAASLNEGLAATGLDAAGVPVSDAETGESEVLYYRGRAYKQSKTAARSQPESAKTQLQYRGSH
jgi:hypothetical protein